MGRSLTFEIVGTPQAKQRVRHTAGGGAYTPLETRQYESLVAMSCREAQMKQLADAADPQLTPEQFSSYLMLKAPVEVWVTAYFPVPEARRKGKHAVVEGQKHCQRPDGDNVLKAVMDGMNSVAFNDDCSVSDKHVMKRWTYGAPKAVVKLVEE